MSLQETEQIAIEDPVVITDNGVDDADNNDADFDSGFDGKLTATPADKNHDESIGNEQESKQGEEHQPAETSSSDAVAEILAKHGKQFDTVYGKLGSIEQVVNGLRQSSAPNISLSAEKLKRTFEEYPELAESLAEDLTEALSGMRGNDYPGVDINEIVSKKIGDTTHQLKTEIAMESLNETNPGWEVIVGMPDENGQIPETNFRKWLAQQPDDYAQRVLNTYSPVVIGRAVDKFNEHNAAQKAATGNTQRLKAAVTPTSGKVQPTSSKSSDDDDFESGFRA